MRTISRIKINKPKFSGFINLLIKIRSRKCYDFRVVIVNTCLFLVISEHFKINLTPYQSCHDRTASFDIVDYWRSHQIARPHQTDHISFLIPRLLKPHKHD